MDKNRRRKGGEGGIEGGKKEGRMDRLLINRQTDRCTDR